LENEILREALKVAHENTGLTLAVITHRRYAVRRVEHHHDPPQPALEF
jgi:hypothetical protein